MDVLLREESEVNNDRKINVNKKYAQIQLLEEGDPVAPKGKDQKMKKQQPIPLTVSGQSEDAQFSRKKWQGEQSQQQHILPPKGRISQKASKQ
jgi:hypothetical protein